MSEKKKKHKIKLSAKLLRTIALILILIMTITVFATYNGLDVIYLGYSAISSFLAEKEIVYAYNDDSDDFFLTMDNIEREYEISVEIYTADKRLVYSSSYRGEMSKPQYDADSITLPDSEQKKYEEVQDLGTTAKNSFSINRDTGSSNNPQYLVGTWFCDEGIIIRSYKIKTATDITARIAIIFVSLVMMVVLSVALIGMSIFIKRTIKPLSNMSFITRNLSKLDFTQKCESNNIEEIAMLSESINEMSDSLETALIDLKQKNKKLEEDIEQEKTIDQLRQVFISGISHELKTPIAIIQGYAEGLKVFLDSDPETAKRYCDTVISETERMNDLVMRLLDITKYESGEYKLMYEDFNIHDTIDDWLTRNKDRLQARGITAENFVDKNIVGFGDMFILSTVINNYMTNAITHTQPPMQIKITSAENNKNGYRISIFNTGTPIAAKDIDKIWNSFYRADKALSRSQGHFGLGLAIVAAIQKLHEQGYGVENHEDGVEFWFDVKKYDSE